VNGNADGVFRLVEDREAIVHVGALLIRDALDALVVDGAVGVARDMHLEAGDLEQAAQIEQNVQIDALLRNAVRGGAAAVDAAVRRINLNKVSKSS